MKTLNEIADAVHKNAIEHGFHPEDEPYEVFLANQCNNLHAEVSELWDAYRGGKFYDPTDKKIVVTEDKHTHHFMSNAEEEYADIIIRALDQMKRLGIDPLACVIAKHNYNKNRPFKHGKLN